MSFILGCKHTFSVFNISTYHAWCSLVYRAATFPWIRKSSCITVLNMILFNNRVLINWLCITLNTYLSCKIVLFALIVLTALQDSHHRRVHRALLWRSTLYRSLGQPESRIWQRSHHVRCCAGQKSICRWSVSQFYK